MEDALPLAGELVFSDINQVPARAATIKTPPDAVIMPDMEGVEAIQALKALGGKLERVVLGDDRVQEREKHPAAIVVKRDDVVDLAIMEMHRLLDDQRTAHRSFMVDSEQIDAVI
jgi:hypothetical protein